MGAEVPVHAEKRRRLTITALTAASVVAVLVSLQIDSRSGGEDDDVEADAEEQEVEAGPKGEFFATKKDVLADPAGFGRPYPNAELEGILVLHRFPDQPMCRRSSNLGTTKVWCGMGWTGQPLIAEHDGRRWAVFGGYDGNIHFMDAITGDRILPDVETGDIIKGTPTFDPDGFPLVYSGSRDDLLRVIAIDRPGQAEVLWTLDSESVRPVLWNDDWDSSPLVLDDYLIVGSESSRFWVIKLNRTTDAQGLVQVAPTVVFTTPAWDSQAISANGDEVASVESSVAVHDNTVYFSTSAGLVLGYDLSGVADGIAPRQVFRFYSGNDADASVVVDDEGYLYSASEYDRPLARAREVGQLTKLDPSNTVNPVVWKFDDSAALQGGVYGTPAINGDTIYFPTNEGRLLGLDRATGATKWERRLPPPVWGSPAVVDDVLLIGDCQGFFHAFDVSNPDVPPPELWSVELGGCIEATPAVWDGRIYIGTRAGHLFVLGDRSLSTSATEVPTTSAPKSSTTIDPDDQ
jgi:outer membrane protein assembly factor BamB